MARKTIVVALAMLFAFSVIGLGVEGQPFTVFHDVMGLPTEPIPQSLTPVVTGNGITGVDLVRGPGINPAPLTNGFSSDGWNMPDQSRAGSIAIGAYYEFGLAVDPGFNASLESLSFSLRRTAVNAPMDFELQVSLDDFTTPGITVGTFNYYGRTSGTALSPNPQIYDKYYHMHSDLPGHANSVDSPGDPIEPFDLTQIEALQNVPGGTKITFRLYAWGNEKTTGTNTVALGRVDGPLITGTVSSQ